jgi:hypothetical protein
MLPLGSRRSISSDFRVIRTYSKFCQKYRQRSKLVASFMLIYYLLQYMKVMCVWGGRLNKQSSKTTFRFTSSSLEYSLNDGKQFFLYLIPRPITAGNQRSPTILYEGGIFKQSMGAGNPLRNRVVV